MVTLLAMYIQRLFEEVSFVFLCLTLLYIILLLKALQCWLCSECAVYTAVVAFIFWDANIPIPNISDNKKVITMKSFSKDGKEAEAVNQLIHIG